MEPYYYNILPFDSGYNFLLKYNLINVHKHTLMNIQFLIKFFFLFKYSIDTLYHTVFIRKTQVLNDLEQWLSTSSRRQSLLGEHTLPPPLYISPYDTSKHFFVKYVYSKGKVNPVQALEALMVAKG